MKTPNRFIGLGLGWSTNFLLTQSCWTHSRHIVSNSFYKPFVRYMYNVHTYVPYIFYFSMYVCTYSIPTWQTELSCVSGPPLRTRPLPPRSARVFVQLVSPALLVSLTSTYSTIPTFKQLVNISYSTIHKYTYHKRTQGMLIHHLHKLKPQTKTSFRDRYLNFR